MPRQVLAKANAKVKTTGAATLREVEVSAPIVLATAVPNRNAPRNSATAASDKACLGRMALDDMAVATTFALL